MFGVSECLTTTPLPRSGNPTHIWYGRHIQNILIHLLITTLHRVVNRSNPLKMLISIWGRITWNMPGGRWVHFKDSHIPIFELYCLEQWAGTIRPKRWGATSEWEPELVGLGPTQGPGSGKLTVKVGCKSGLSKNWGDVWPGRPPPGFRRPRPIEARYRLLLHPIGCWHRWKMTKRRSSRPP